MGFLGGVIKITGKVAGKAVEYGIKGTGGIVAFVAQATENPELAAQSIKISGKAGESLGKVTEKAGEGLGYAMDKAIEYGSSAGGALGGYIAESAGADEKQIRTAKMVGSMVGGGTVGFVSGDVIGAGITSFTIAHGVSSTGTAISALHGAAATKATLASIGGGALSAGGGGIAVGHAILNGIDVATTVAGSIDGGVSKKLSKDIKVVPRDSFY